ncbi:polymorphic toxin-type HINT domain-containing protein [Micromonospora humida]|uniref:polymorphic toxin-type HINT domain-containing protein n=1 Tax=Micromonospora humida TaxID=2809018 RepID=UPI0034081D49
MASKSTPPSGQEDGTAQETIDASTLASTRRKFTPYGQARGTQPSVWPGQKGFVGGTIDSSTGLTHLGAREYEPGTGRFVSVDPIVDFTDPQQMQGYAYANNSPVSFSDASGLRFCADDNCSGNGGGVAGTGPPPKSTGTTPPAGGTKTPSGPSQDEVNKAKSVKEKKILDIVIQAGGQILLEVLGINDIRDCVMKGDIGACAMAVVGALPWGKIFKAKKIGEAAVRAGKAVLTWFDEMKWAQRVLAQADEAAALATRQADEAAAAAAKQADDAAATAAKQGDDVAESAGSSCKIGNSFTPDTRVVLADGSTRAIEDIALGDEVLATDPETGQTESRKVVGLIVGDGHKNLVEVTVDTDGTQGDESGSVIATDGHPFWVADLEKWVPATELEPGQWLRTSAGTYVQVEAVREFTQERRVHNLTVEGIHTYHVVAGATEILVHNDSCVTGAKDAAKAAADEAAPIRPAAARPRVAEAVELKSGNVISSTSIRGATVRTHPAVQAVLNTVPPAARGVGHGQCGLVVCLSQALFRGESPVGARAAAVLIRGEVSHPKHGLPIGPCPSCQSLVDHFDIDFLT